jgi:signal transduction histidine kinase
MSRPLRVLFVEDIERDMQLIVGELRRSGLDMEFERVDSHESMSAALGQQVPWDVILADYTMPQFSAPLALKLVQEMGVEAPFILVSGTASEEVAVEMLHAGAHDFVFKGRLGRLIPAIQRELAKVALLSEKKRMQEQLMISDRMASMGILAAGVVHEISNPLACIIANLELAAFDLIARSDELGHASGLLDVIDELGDAREATERIRSVIRDLKLFSRSDDDEVEAVDVQQVMESTLRLASNEIRHRARLVQHYGNTRPVRASESRLGQVFLNLVINAAQAIPEGRAEENEILISTSTNPNGTIRIEIGDTGLGMRPEVLERVFAPFFTTKAVGEGTGLGLSICHRIITDFGGTIEVVSEVGKGSTFLISLPPAGAEVLEAPEKSAPLEAAPRRGRILVVDDEPTIARVVQRILATEHEVIALTSADEALKRIAGGEQFDVILSDLMMPEMTGMDLHDALSRISPSLAERMIFLTGGAFTTRARDFLGATPNQWIEKPFTTGHLRTLVNNQIRLTPLSH